VDVLLPAEPCLRCEENRFRNEACLLPEQVCMLGVPPARVIAALERALAQPPTRRPTPAVTNASAASAPSAAGTPAI
jgi:hypothetical protein